MKKVLKILLFKPVKYINKLVLSVYLYILKNKVKNIKPLDIANKKVLIFSPHQDDELLGCGCTIKKALQLKAQVKCIYITDGSQSLSNDLTIEEMIEVRKAEAMRLTEHLGMDEPVFLGCPDSFLEPDDENAINNIAKVIENYKPDVIFIPYFLDGHKDHTAVSSLYLASLELIDSCKELETYCYEINSPISVYGITHYIDCTGCLDSKKDAMKFYESQTMSFESIFLMNQLNRILTGVKEGAELFKKIDLNAYKHAYNTYNNDNKISYCFGRIYSIYFMIPAYFKGMKLKKEIAFYMNSARESFNIKELRNEGDA